MFRKFLTVFVYISTLLICYAHKRTDSGRIICIFYSSKFVVETCSIIVWKRKTSHYRYPTSQWDCIFHRQHGRGYSEKESQFFNKYLLKSLSLRMATASAMSSTPHILIHSAAISAALDSAANHRQIRYESFSAKHRSHRINWTEMNWSSQTGLSSEQYPPESIMWTSPVQFKCCQQNFTEY